MENTGKKLLENLSQQWTDIEVLDFLHSCPQMLRDSFCFRPMIAYTVNQNGGDAICMMYVPENPEKSLLITITRADSDKAWGNNELIPRLIYSIGISIFDFRATFFGLKPAIQEEKEERYKQSKWKINDYQALANLFRKNAPLINEKEVLRAEYERKCYWGWVKNLLALWQTPSLEQWRREQIIMMLERFYQTLDERLYDLNLNKIEYLSFFAG